MQELLNIPINISINILTSLLIIIIALVLLRLTSIFRHRIDKKIKNNLPPRQNVEQMKTLIMVIDYLIRITILFIAVAMVLMVFGVNLAPLLATVGVASLAISLGAQTLFKDYVGGVIIIAENLFYVGDRISVGLIQGTVESVTLRATYLRGAEGNIIIIPNGEIRTLTRENTDWVRTMNEIHLPFQYHYDEVVDDIRNTISNWREDPGLTGLLLEDPELTVKIKPEDGSVNIQIITKTKLDARLKASTSIRRITMQVMESRGLESIQ